tara:strand:- start:430 stop:897 length:468 start_codon:yes stop_codon:yes gene_type:complete
MKQLFLVCSLLLLFSCDKKQEKTIEMPAPEKHFKEAYKEDPCDTDFDVFFKKFQSDSIFQRQHVKFPLKNTYLNSDGDYEVLRKDITVLNYRFLDFTKDEEAAKAENGAFTINIEKEKDSVFYQARGIDNGIHEDIKFAFIDGCWYLVAIEDSST